MEEQTTAIRSGCNEGLNQTLDLIGVCCPMNFVHTKLAIQKIKQGDRIEILLDDGEPIANVTRSLRDEGHLIHEIAPEDGHFRVRVEKR